MLDTCLTFFWTTLEVRTGECGLTPWLTEGTVMGIAECAESISHFVAECDRAKFFAQMQPEAMQRMLSDGFFSFRFRDAYALTWHAMEVVRISTSSAAAVIHNVHMQSMREQDLYYRATHDALTGLWDRAAFAEVMEREIARGFCGALCLCDVDHFKRINDMRGHLYGDHVLCRTAATLREACQAGAFLGRFGGDEFLLALCADTPSHAKERIFRLGEMLSAQWEEYSCSIGAVFLQRGVCYREAIEAADRALYYTKRNGRHGFSICGGDGGITYYSFL